MFYVPHFPVSPLGPLLNTGPDVGWEVLPRVACALAAGEACLPRLCPPIAPVQDRKTIAHF